MKSLPLLFATVFGPLAAAQSTLIVDVQSRPGTQYTDLQSAVDAAQPGDVVFVRNGTYFNGAVIDKGIRVLGEPGVVFRSLVSLQRIAIQNVPSGETAVLRDVRISQGGCCNLGHVSVTDCDGAVLLQNIEIDPVPFRLSFANAGFRIANSDRVVLTGCVDQGNGLTIQDSVVTAVDGSFRGHPFFPPRIIGGFPVPSKHGAFITGSTVVFSRCSLVAGDTDRAGVMMSGSTVTVTDIAGTTEVVVAGSSSAAIAGDGALTLDPDVQIIAAAGIAPISAAIVVTNEPVPSLAVTGAPIGGQVDGNLVSAPNEVFVVGIGVPIAPSATPFGVRWVSLSAYFILASGMLDGNGSASWSFAVPNDQVFLGAVLTYQGLAATSAGIRFSNAGEHVITATGL